MRIKFTLERAAGPVDLVATVDAATTVGDLAGFLLSADPDTPANASVEVTLGIAGPPHVTLDAHQPVAESHLRSGATVTISTAGKQFSDPEQQAAAVLTIVEGPDAGKTFRLAAGSSIIGRDNSCDVKLNDPLISRAHARLNVTDIAEIIDLGSANGVLVDETAVPRATLRAADVIVLGDTKLSVRLLRNRSAVPASAGSSVDFVRAHRPVPIYAGSTFEAPEPPERQASQRFPIIALVAPLLMGGVLFAVTKNAASLIFVGLSPLMLIGNNVEQRMAKRSANRGGTREYREDLDSLIDDLETAAQEERAGRQAEHPSAADCAAALNGPTSLLWSRQPDQTAFAQLRLGLGRQPSRTTVTYPRLKRSIRALHTQMHEELEPFIEVDDVPVVGDFHRSAVGVAGPASLTHDVVRGLLLQVAALHSPAELAIAVMTSSRSAAAWQWLSWLPHTSTQHSAVTGRLLTSSSVTGGALAAELEDLVDQRAGRRDAEHSPAVFLVVDSDAPVEHSRLVDLATDGPAVGVHVLWLADDLAHLPSPCRTYLSLDASQVAALAVVDGSPGSPVACEPVDELMALTFARALAPIVDIGARLDDVTDLPRAVSLLSITGPELGRVPAAVIERWTANRSIVSGPKAPAEPPKHVGTLRAVIGKTGLDVHALDLRADGPHALVGGTSGSGKSELLQTWILGMAVAHSPQRLTFLLVDYKGGSAFRDCADLPHTVGLVTDLSQHLVRRALTSLAAELRYREHVLAKHAAKDLASLEKAGIAEAPPSLVIVVDEFAALVNEVPEFVDGMVNVAQRGRSLGLHLILATQRPAGVIKDNLRANSNLRVALRTADEIDSTDVLGSPQAAFFDSAVPGRAVSKTGPRRLVPFQTGYVGGWTSDETPPPEIVVEELTVGLPRAWTPPDDVDFVLPDPGPTDIKRVVQTIGEASKLAGIPLPRKPWLPELLTVYDLADRKALPSRRVDTELVFGVKDDPVNQVQPTVAFYPDRDGSMVVYGASGSGKTALLRTIAIAAGFTIHGGPSQIYGLDFGARGLAMLEDLPHVGSVIPGSDNERVVRLLRMLRAVIDDRALRYSQHNAGTLTDYRRLTGEQDEARIILLLDGIVSFRSAYEGVQQGRLLESFTSIIADGRPVGVHVVVTSDQRNGLTTAMGSAIQARLVLRMANVDDYAGLGVASDVIATSAGPGRGVFAGEEVQVAVLGGASDSVTQASQIRKFARAMRRNGAVEVEPIRSLPELVPLESLPVAVDGLPALGISSETLGPVGFKPSGTWIVAGPPGSGRTSTLRVLAQSLHRFDPALPLMFIGNPRSPLTDESLWKEIFSPSDMIEAAKSLEERIVGGERLALFIESVPDMVNSPADLPMQSLLKRAASNDCFVVSEGETSAMTPNYGLLATAKSGKTGILLTPSANEGANVLGVNFPAMAVNDRLPGRGVFVRSAKYHVVQLAYPGSD